MKKILLALLVFLLLGCSNNTSSNPSSTTGSSSKSCLSGEYYVDGSCCRYNYKYPNKDGSCPYDYDDDPPPGGNYNVCWKEVCR